MDMTHTKDELIDFGILVLSTAAWPLNPSKTEFNIPSELLKTFERFQGFYGSQHNGRKLTWLFHHSKGEIKTNYLSQNKTFMVSLHFLHFMR
jgi:cullin 1